MTTLADVQAQAWNVLALPTPKKLPFNPDTAIGRFWLANKSEVGARMTAEIPLDDGTAAMIMSSSKVLHWTGGDAVEVV